jgi:hypothetical protein
MSLHRFDSWFFSGVTILFLALAPPAFGGGDGGQNTLLAEVASLARAFELPAIDPPELALCRKQPDSAACLDALRASYAAMPALQGSPLETGLSQRLSHALAEEIVFRQRTVLPAGSVPARFRPIGEGRLIHLEPAQALVPGQSYQVLLDGLAVVGMQSAAQPRSPVTAAVAKSLEVTLAKRLAAETLTSAGQLVTELEAQAAAAPGLPALAGVRVLLAAPLSVENLREVRVGFVPVAGATGPRSFVVADSVSRLRAARRDLAELPCNPIQLRSDRSAPGHFRYRGRFPAPGPAGEVVWLPFLMALPTPLPERPELVVLVDGLGGSMERLFADQAPALLERGLGAVAVELPLHGIRSDGTKYLAADKPADLARLLPQGALDVMAAIRQIRTCGVELAPGRRLSPLKIHFFGYSLGGMTGILVRAAEPALSRMVLVAPSADLADWLSLTAVRERGVPLVTCAGGPDHGKACLGHGRCAGAGICLINPSFDSVDRHIRWSWLVAATGADPADYAGRPAGEGPLLILSAGKDGILAPRQTYRLAVALGMDREGAHRWVGPGARLQEWPDLGHGLVSHPEVRQTAHDFLQGQS